MRVQFPLPVYGIAVCFQFWMNPTFYEYLYVLQFIHYSKFSVVQR